MPRSRLLTSLVRLAKDFSLAEAHDVSPETVRQKRLEQRERERSEGINRRQLLAGAATLAAVAAAPKAHAAVPLPDVSVAIIGGGIAGLNCALKLQDKGFRDVKLYEANTRLGGRMHSVTGYFDQGQVSEWCGELIDTGHQTIRDLATRFNLPLHDLIAAQPAGSEDTYFFFNCYYPRAQAVLDFAPVWKNLKASMRAAPYPTTWDNITPGGRVLDNTSVYEWIEQYVPGGHGSPMGAMLDIAYCEELAVDTRLQSSLNMLYLLGFQPDPKNFEFFGESDERYHIAGGNERLPMAIADELGGPGGPIIRTGHALQALKKKADGRYQLTLKNGNTTLTKNVDYVVMAVPFSILRGLDYSQAGFDSRKDYAIRNLGAGTSGKLSLQFNQRMWNSQGAWPGVSNGNTYADTGYQNSWDVTRGQSGNKGIVVNYTGGPVALALSARNPYSFIGSQGVQNDVSHFLMGIERVLPGISAKWNGKAASSVPHLDPFLKLSYSHWKTGQYQQFAGYEGVRQGNVLFAGEHCSVDFQGFMEGAALTGRKAGGDIFRDIT